MLLFSLFVCRLSRVIKTPLIKTDSSKTGKVPLRKHITVTLRKHMLHCEGSERSGANGFSRAQGHFFFPAPSTTLCFLGGHVNVWMSEDAVCFKSTNALWSFCSILQNASNAHSYPGKTLYTSNFKNLFQR